MTEEEKMLNEAKRRLGRVSARVWVDEDAHAHFELYNAMGSVSPHKVPGHELEELSDALCGVSEILRRVASRGKAVSSGC